MAQNAIIKEDTEALLAVLNSKISGDEIFKHFERVQFISADPRFKYILLNLLDYTLKNPFILFSEDLESKAQSELSLNEFQNYALWFQEKYRSLLPEIRDLRDPNGDEYLSFAKLMIASRLALDIQVGELSPKGDQNIARLLNSFARPVYKTQDISQFTNYIINKFSPDYGVNSNSVEQSQGIPKD